MMTSAAGLELIEAREGRRLQMYRDQAGYPTIGVGHKLTPSERASGKLFLESGAIRWADGITDEQVLELLRHDVHAAEQGLETGFPGYAELAQHQFDALVSFIFNVGVPAFKASTLLKRLKSGALADVPAQLRRWVYDAGAVDHVLVVRRESEVAQWLAA